MTEIFAPLPPGPFQVIEADPPWFYRGSKMAAVDKDGNAKRSCSLDHYPSVKIEDLCEMPVPDIIDPEGCVLFMWATGPLLLDALRLMKAWKFKYKQIAFVWDKQITLPGSYTITQHEYVLVGTHKRIPQPRGSRKVRQLVSSRKTRKHSQKPAEVHQGIEAMFPTQNKIELFARTARPGWAAYGNQLPEATDE